MQYAVRNIALAVPFDRAFAYIADPTKLPEWTNAFAEVAEDGRARMRTPEGEVEVRLKDTVDKGLGVIDTRMTFPDGSVGSCFSRLMALDEGSCLYSFTLTPPLGALEDLEGDLAAQAGIVEQELLTLKTRLEG